MKKFLIAALCFICAFTIACAPATTPDGRKSSDKDVTVSMAAWTTDKEYEFGFDYDDGYFSGNANVFNKDLAMISFGASLASSLKERSLDFFTTLGFDNIKPSDSYDVPPTANSIGYTLAHKKIADKNVIALAIRGFNYGSEWVSNVSVGLMGNHNGFEQSANTVSEGLLSYLSENEYDNLTLWITGYSRAGAVANVLADKILSGNEVDVLSGNVFVYTFEAPKALTEKREYQNVFNMVNSADMVAHLCPEEYGLYRCGTDVDIYSYEKLANLVKAFDSSIVLPKFNFNKPQNGSSEQEQFESPSEFIEYFITSLLKEMQGDDIVYDISTRENFHSNVEPTLLYTLNLVFSLKAATINAIVEDIKSMGFIALATLIYDENGIYNFLNPYIAADGVSYEPTELQAQTETIRKFILRDNYLTLGVVAASKDNLVYTVDMHFPVITYVLLADYCK